MKLAFVVSDLDFECPLGKAWGFADTDAPERLKPCGCRERKLVGTSAMPPIVRPSCIECTEKHLGAAWVLLAECRDGYAHRLRAIGHLHEAEDESQAWPELHDAIRSARRNYQEDKVIPDFSRLADLAQNVRADFMAESPSASA